MLVSLSAITIFGLALGWPEDRAQPGASQLGPVVRMTRDGLEKQRPHWSPDGKQLLYARYEADGGQIWLYTQSIDGTSSPPRRLTGRKSPEYDGVFAPDGTRVLFASITLSGTQGNLDVERIDVDGS